MKEGRLLEREENRLTSEFPWDELSSTVLSAWEALCYVVCLFLFNFFVYLEISYMHACIRIYVHLSIYLTISLCCLGWP